MRNDWIAPEEADLAMAHGDGKGIRIAVLDSGIEIGHPDFLGRGLRDDLAVEGEEFRPGRGEDLYGHGTALAGIIWKLAPKAEIGSFRVLGPNLSARTAMVSLAADRAIDLGYQVLNCSFACGISGHLALYKRWTDRAALEGAHVVAASGSHDFSRPEWPAHLGTVLGVDCSTASEKSLRHRARSMVEFAAHGSEVRVAWKDSGHRVMTGSSFAAAHLSGLLARLLSVHGLRDVLLAKALLRRAAGQATGQALENSLRSV